jgi:hypothetical protein
VKYVPDWFPGTEIKIKAREWRRVTTEGVMIPFQYVKDAMVRSYVVFHLIFRNLQEIIKAKGVHIPSVASWALEQCKDDNSTEDIARSVTGTAYFGW